MRGLRRTLALIGLAGAATVLAVGPAAASPYYSWQWGQNSTYYCDNHVGGGTQGDYFLASAFGGAGCNTEYVELIYIDNNGTEQVARNSQTGGSQGPSTQIWLPNGSFQQILEVIGSGTDIAGNNTGGVYLYYY